MKCDKCGEDKSDVMTRLFLAEVNRSAGFVKDNIVFDPALCTACCSEMPGRVWMKNSIPADDASAA